MARGGNTNPALMIDINQEQIGSVIDELFKEKFAIATRSVCDHVRATFPDAELFVVGGAIRDIVAGRRPKDLDIMVRLVPEHELVHELEQLAGKERLAAYMALDQAGRQRVLDVCKDQINKRMTQLLDELHILDPESEEGRSLATKLQRVRHHKLPVLEMDVDEFDHFIAEVPPKHRIGFLPTLRGRLGREGDQFTVTRYHGLEHTEVEIVLPRADVSTGDGHRDVDPRADHTMHVEDDMSRRDFTVNAMAWNMQTRTMIDPFNGQDDLAHLRLRTVSDQSFKDDRLRMIRGLVLAGRYGLTPDETCDAQYRDQASEIVHVTRPRIHDEMMGKLLPSADPAFAVRIGERYGLISYALKDLPLDVDALERAQYQTNDPVLRLAALIHDAAPARAAKTLHEVHYERDVTARVSTLLAAASVPAPDDHADLAQWADSLKSRGNALDAVRLQAWVKGEDPATVQTRVERYSKALDRPLFRSEIAITGNDLIELGVEKGQRIGQLLSAAQAAVWADPACNERSRLLQKLGL